MQPKLTKHIFRHPSRALPKTARKHRFESCPDKPESPETTYHLVIIYSRTTSIPAMELSAKILDVVRASADNAVKGSSVIDFGRELYTWTVRERIPEPAFIFCAEPLIGVTYPNEYGLQLPDSLGKPTSKTKRLAGLNINLAGSVGRLMAFDIDCCYMVTTVAVVMEFHNMAFASTVLCNMTLDKGIQEKALIIHTTSEGLGSNLSSRRSSRVLRSTWSIPGIYSKPALPSELNWLCVHVTDPGTFAVVIIAVQWAEEDIVILCGVFSPRYCGLAHSSFHGCAGDICCGQKDF
jgi:hypothetical protein